MVKLEKSKRKPKEHFQITKTGKVTRKGKTISKAYEKKYSHKIVQNYSVDSRGILHDSKGRFVKKEVKQKYDTLIETSKKRTEKKLSDKQPSTTSKVYSGKFMKSNYALTFECTCYIEEGVSTHEEDKVGHVVTHYYTISSSRLIKNSEAKRKHDNHYPTHSLINIEHSSTKVLQIG